MRLVEAIDALLHDLSLMPDRPERTRWLSDRLRVLPPVSRRGTDSGEKARRSR